MNKRQVEEYLPRALEALNSPESKIARDGKIPRSFRGQISSFGAAVTMGSFKAAVAFFSDNGSADVPRSELIRAMYFVVHGAWKTAEAICGEVLRWKQSELFAEKECFLNASVALKLAMNAFELTVESEPGGGEGSA